MASSEHPGSQATKVSLSINAHTEETTASSTSSSSLQFFEEHGYFCQPNADIGALIEKLYDEKRAGDQDVNLAYFASVLQSIDSMTELLGQYPNVRPFKELWGIVPRSYYSWDNPSTTKNGMIIYLLGPKSKGTCLDGSHLRRDDVKGLGDDHTIHAPNNKWTDRFSKAEYDQVDGGILCVHPVLWHKTESGRSIVFGAKRNDNKR
ncbi:hypothetical protein FOYG_17614 [Fusarium oxysporum NRRL 32931]|uniref:Phytanoyl-CoA dioxygenase n=1 Tax=Fusarium oxysporum NRRL 32931 TaxID=660029 RepID=W9HDY1_FUSOX|nr:hypothetical protein FOYG_17614 [Fusarium oxysporum NRRL 32931]